MATIFYSIKQEYDYCNKYKEQLHLKTTYFKDNSCLYVDGIVLPILNCLCMFIFLYNSVRALGTLGPVLDLF